MSQEGEDTIDIAGAVKRWALGREMEGRPQDEAWVLAGWLCQG